MAEQTKERLLWVLRILRDTDREHLMNTAAIMEQLRIKGIDAERKAVQRDIAALKEAGYPILHEKGASGGYRMEPLLEDWEIKVLSDAVLSAGFLTEADREALNKKLYGFGSRGGRHLLRGVRPVPSNVRVQSSTIRENIEALLSAIRGRRMILFDYEYIGPDKCKHPKFPEGVRPVSPYTLIWRQDRYYLIGNYGVKDMLSYYRVDRMRNIRETGDPAVPMKDYLGDNEEEKLAQFIAQNLDNRNGEQVWITLAADADRMDTLLDAFGPDIHTHQTPTGQIECTVRVNDGIGLYDWLLKNGDKIRVTAPQSVRDKLAERIGRIINNYNQKEGN